MPNRWTVTASLEKEPFGEHAEGLFIVSDAAVHESRAQTILPGSIGIGKCLCIHASQSGVSWATVPAA